MAAVNETNNSCVFLLNYKLTPQKLRHEVAHMHSSLSRDYDADLVYNMSLACSLRGLYIYTHAC